jgi:hypothetical protein
VAKQEQLGAHGLRGLSSLFAQQLGKVLLMGINVVHKFVQISYSEILLIFVTYVHISYKKDYSIAIGLIIALSITSYTQ